MASRFPPMTPWGNLAISTLVAPPSTATRGVSVPALPSMNPQNSAYRTAADRASRIRRAPTRQRILHAAVEATAACGYPDLTVALLIEHAGISRSTFYEHFPNRDQCFLAALDSLGEDLIAHLETVEMSDSPTPGPLVEALCAHVGDNPRAAKVLFSESLAAGPRSLDFRERLQRRVAILIAAASDVGMVQDEPGLTVLDDLIGGLFRLFAMRLRRDPAGDGVLCPNDLAAWVDSYVGAFAKASRTPLGEITPQAVEPTEEFALEPLAAGRHRLTEAEVEMNQRLRICAAMVRLSHESGYAQVTVAQITVAARVSRNAFYRHFQDKAEAANQALELIFEQVIGACAGAFSSASQWPERIWRTGQTFAGFFTSAPDYAHVGMVETHAVGEEMVELVYDRISAFALFLEEGYRWRPEAENLPRITSEAVGATMYEIAFRALRERRPPGWYAALLPQFVFILLAPFMGPETALEFVQRKSGDESPHLRSSHGRELP